MAAGKMATTTTAATSAYLELIPGNTPIGDMVDFLNKFFETPENRALPIGFGVRIFVMKLQGSSESEINATLRTMRQQVAALDRK